MQRVLSSVSRAVYVYVAKPIMFRFSPDSVHRNLVRVARVVQRIAPFRIAVGAAWRYKSHLLTQTLHGQVFANPVGLSAGFDKNAELAPLMEQVGFGFMTAGSITGYRCKGNERPWFHRLPSERSIVVNAGLPNVGSRTVAKRLAKDRLTSRRRLPLMLSVARTNTPASSTDEQAIADYVLGLKNLRAHADMFEINISCPNTYGGEPFTTPKRLDALLAAVDALHVSQPVFIKMPSHLGWSDYRKLLEVIVRHAVTGVTVSNLRKDRSGVTVDPSVKGNLSGRPTKILSDQLIAKTYSNYGDRLTIIGVGGIFTAQDAYDKIKHGASLVALVTGLIYEGPQIVGQINRELEQLIIADGYTHISQAVGANHRHND